MNTQVLVVTMNQTNTSLIEKMNIQTSAIVGNQCNRNEIEEFNYKGHYIKWLSFSERGVGLNRNNVLMRSTADICIFADDDMIFKDDYEHVVVDLFEKYPDIDIFIFNLDEDIPKRYKNTKFVKVNKFNFGKYGGARIAIRRNSVISKGVLFHLQFGGGAIYSSGEDSIFLHDCLKKGLKIMAAPIAIAKLTINRNSTWFEGYNDKFFFDKGVFYGYLYPRMCKSISLYNCYKHISAISMFITII